MSSKVQQPSYVNKDDDSSDTSILFGHKLAQPPPGEEICITGISGMFPNSHNIQEFRDNLMGKIDMVDDDERKWKHFHPEIPTRGGKLYDLEKFDAGYFGVHFRQAKTLDPINRLFLERTIEAIVDSGYNPSEFEGTRTGVFVGAWGSESEILSEIEQMEPQSFNMTGCLRSLIPQRVSYFLKLRGPSVVADTACSSAMYAFENAYVALRTGLCDMAIVGGANLCQHPFTTLQFNRLGVLSPDGKCKTFDANADGYCRSESINCIILQKAKDARRIYSTVLHTKTNCDGYKVQGLLYPSGEMQGLLMKEVYQECGIDPTSVSYLEAHGTGTVVGDPVEIEAVDRIFCQGRQLPLLIGSVKSNIGHTETSSGLCSITKCIIAMEENMIPPNIHFKSPRQALKAFAEGRAKVVSEKIPFQDDRGLTAVNCFGFGGANAHVLLNWNSKVKKNDTGSVIKLPRLLCVSARTAEGISSLTEVPPGKVDDEYIGLLHQVFRKNFDGHIYRGYAVLSKEGEILSSSNHQIVNQQPLVISFGCFGKSWRYLVEQLNSFQSFGDTMKRIQSVLDTKGIDIIRKIEPSMKNPVLYSIIGTVALHLGIIELFRTLEIQPSAVIGHAIGEIACGYLEEILTLEEAILVGYQIGLHLEAIQELSPEALMNNQLKEHRDISVTWDHLRETSGSIEMDKLKNGSSVTIFSKHISTIEKKLLLELKKIITKPKDRTRRWISSPSDSTATAEFFVKALHSEMYHLDLEDLCLQKAYSVAIGHTNIQMLKRGSVDVHEFGNTEGSGVLSFLELIGSIYERGTNPQIQNIYPKIQFPVSRGTPMINSKIKWDHSKDWYVLKFEQSDSKMGGEAKFVMNKEEWEFAKGHVIDGRNLFPATGYLKVIWEHFAKMINLEDTHTSVELENCKFKRALAIREETEFSIMIQKNTGNFEIIDGDADIVTGRIRQIDAEEDKNLTYGFHETLAPDTLKLKKKDIYKELRLRGYNYKGVFRGIEECNCEGTEARIRWDGNWVSFMDCMLQMLLMQIDTRVLYVPTGIRKLTIHPKKHLDFAAKFGENPLLPVFASKDTGIIRCGGIEIQGLMANSIPRRKQRAMPVLENYVFVPNEAKMKIEDSLRVNIQIGLENFYNIKRRVIEVIDEATRKGSEPFGAKIFDVFADLPLIQPEISIYSKEQLDLPNVSIEDKALQQENDCHLIVGTNILQRPTMLQKCFDALCDKGFILSREEKEFRPQNVSLLDILTIHDVGDEKIVYFRRAGVCPDLKCIEVSNKREDFSWLPTLQSTLKHGFSCLLYVQNEPCNGLLGLFNCLRQEPGGINIRCLIINDTSAPKFDPKIPFYRNQLDRNMAVNIYENGRWGTYRHLLMDELKEVATEHCFANTTVAGDLSSLKWIQGPLNTNSVLPPEKTLIQVHYAALNFRDIMTATGRISADVITKNRIDQECVQGIEFAGIDATGKRVMGSINHGALSSLLVADRYITNDIPKGWTMEQAATIPVVYSTVIYAFEVGRMKRGDSVLIHSGTGGIGIAAINYALAKGCLVFTTAGTPEKRKFIRKMFPQINENRIGNSRDISFERMVKRVTRGRGVDLVLNSLAEDKLQASVRCLAPGGRFLEIGKFDLASNNVLNLNYLNKGCSFHGIMIDRFFDAPPYMKKKIRSIIKEGIEGGYVKPLATTVFKMNELEKAYRYMATGKHMGKVLVQIRKEELGKTARIPATFTSSPRFTCDSRKCQIICGGLGGFGMELADWLILRGARKLVLTSRTGVQTGFQSYRLNIWKSYGVIVKASTADITNPKGCQQLIEEAETLGQIETIFNLAVVLRDALCENQSSETFKISLAPKASATQNLDAVTRIRCPNLRHFVVFSSVSCGRGNTGQTNYGMANSIMERICEQRKLAGFPALAIQWGAVGDVGLVADMMEEQIELEIGGTLQQGINSCLQVMDVFLRQDEATIVSSMLVADKRSGGTDDIVESIGRILGLNVQTISPHSRLSELGMDSMSAVEIKQIIERELGVFLTAQDIRNLTVDRLKQIQDSKDDTTGIQQNSLKTAEPLDIILRYIADENISTQLSLKMTSLIEDDSANVPYLFLFPGIEGYAALLVPLATKIKAKVIGIQFNFNESSKSFHDTAVEVAQLIESHVKSQEKLNVLCYSFGTVICLETMSILEQKGYKGNITCLDGSPDLMVSAVRKEMHDSVTDAELETKIICHIMKAFFPMETVSKSRKILLECQNLEHRLSEWQRILEPKNFNSPTFHMNWAISLITRIKELRNYKVEFPKLQSKVRLLKASSPMIEDFIEDFNLSTLCTGPVDVKIFEGDHITILEDPGVADTINEIIGMK